MNCQTRLKMLRYSLPKTADRPTKLNNKQCMKRRYLAFIGGIAAIQFFYSIWLIDLEKRFFQKDHDTSLEIFQAGAWKQDSQTCTFTEPTRILPENRQSFNQTVQILQEEVFYSYALVLILCLDSNSEEISIITYAQYDWAKMFILPDTFWGDVYLYTNILEDLLVTTNYITEWIGSIPTNGSSSYKSVNDMNVIWIHRMLSDAILIEDRMDVLVFMDSHEKVYQGTQFHPLWMDLTYIALDSLGDNKTDASMLIDFITQHPNYFRGISFVARPTLIRQWIIWIRTVIDYFRSDSRFLLILQRVPCEEMKRTVQMYISHFLLSYFFISRDSQIMMMSVYKDLERCKQHIENENVANELSNNIQEVLSSEAASEHQQLYILCHSKDSCLKASEQYIYYSWGKYLYFIPSTNILETYFYTNVLENLLESSSLKPYWVGSISWKAMTKTYVNVIDRMLSDMSLVEDGYDVLGFWTPLVFDPRYCNSSMFIHSNHVHTGLIQFIEYILKGIGETAENISLLREAYPTFKSFYGSYFVARPIFMQEYIAWIRKVMVFIAKDPVARTYVWSDSHYTGDASVPLKVFGVEFYPLHPFVGERLLQYFFNSRKASIALLFEYMEKNGISNGYYYYPCRWWMDVNYNYIV